TEKNSKPAAGKTAKKQKPEKTEIPAKTPDESIDKKFSDYIRPMMARLHDEAFNNPDWIFEIQWDGYRALAEITGKETRLYSRNGLSFQKKYPPIYDALKALKKPMVLDGEIVALNKKGIPDFQLLQQYGMNDKV